MGSPPQRTGRHGRRDLRPGSDSQHCRDLGSGAKTEMQAHETELANQRRVAFLIESYSLLHQVGTGAIMEASTKLLPGQAGAATQEEASRILQQWLKFFQQAIELPPNEFASRVVIARAYSRLGYTYWMLSIAKGTQNGLEPGLLAQALSNYRRSVKLLEELLADSPGDPKIQRYLAEALGLGNMGCCLRTAVRTEEAEPLYLRAIQVRRELLCGTSTGSVADVRTQPSGPAELDDLLYLVSTVHLMAGLMDDRGHVAEAEDLRRAARGRSRRRRSAVVSTRVSEAEDDVGKSAHDRAASPLRSKPAPGYDDQSPTGARSWTPATPSPSIIWPGRSALFLANPGSTPRKGLLWPGKRSPLSRMNGVS